MTVIPDPQRMELTGGQYWLRDGVVVCIDPCLPPEALDCALLLQREIQETIGLRAQIARGLSRDGGILLTRSDTGRAEGYTVSVTDGGVTLAGEDGAGLLYAVQTMRQLLRQSGALVPCCEILDWPAIPRRGYYMDATRGRVPTLDFLKRLADTMSFFKLNELQLYIEHSYLFAGESEMWRGGTPLTAQEIMELDAYCRRLHIDLVPSLASFGHLYHLLRTRAHRRLCELEGQADRPFSLRERMAHHTLNCTDPESLELAESLIAEYMELFSSRYFNICCDETFDLGKGRSREEARRRGVTALYVGFVTDLARFLLDRGRVPMFWSDIISAEPSRYGELPKELICLHWDYSTDPSEERLARLAASGADKLYVCPGVQGWNHLIPRAGDAFRNISRMCSLGHRYGAMGVLNTDWGDFGHVNHPTLSLPGLIYGAAFSWNSRIPPEDEINRRISELVFADPTGGVMDIIRELGQQEAFGWYRAVSVKEAAEGVDGSRSAADALAGADIARAEACCRRLHELTRRLSGYLRTVPPEARPLLRAYLLAAEGQALLNRALPYLPDALAPSRDGAAGSPELAAGLERWFLRYRELWCETSKESELFRIGEVIFWYADLLRPIE